MNRNELNRRLGRDWLSASLFLTPNLVIALVFVVSAMVYVFNLSLYDWNLISPDRTFVGFQNYRDVINDRVFRQALWNTVYYVGAQVPLSMGFSIVLAVLLNQAVSGVKWFRALYFLPSVLPVIAIAQVWIIMYEPNFGTFNWIMESLGLPRLNWLTDPRTAMPSVIIFSVWRVVGYNMVIYLAALQDIPKMLYESASIDGANPLQKFFRITLPNLRPASFFVLITSIIGSFQVFGEIFVMTQGGPVNSTNVIAYYLYQSGFKFFKIGYASSIGFILFIILFAFTVFQWRQYAQKGEN
jgi:multiple sugar transport system permease protein